MKRLLLIAALLGGGCGTTTDDRPKTLEYITDAILAPTCASAECHSAFKRQVGDQFDTVDAARVSIVGNGLVDTTSPTDSVLYVAITKGAPSILSPGSGNVRMPYDEPMPDADVALILAWIQAGAHGGQCVPNAMNQGCARTLNAAGTDVIYQVVNCSNGDIGAVVTTCTGGQVCRLDTGNGQCVTP